MVLDSCEQCRFFSPRDWKSGICRRHPPGVVAVSGAIEPETVWPRVEKLDGCGDFIKNMSE